METPLSPQQQLTEVTRTDNPYDNILTKAELLLTYAADNGIEVGEPERRAIYNFRLIDKKDRNADIVDCLYLAYIKLSKAVTPRTAESITETSRERNRGVQKYRKIAVIFSLLLSHSRFYHSFPPRFQTRSAKKSTTETV